MTPPASEFVRTLKEEERASYFMNLKQLGFPNEEDDPFLVDLGLDLDLHVSEIQHSDSMKGKWSASDELWPVVEFGNVYVYLIDCPGYSHQSLKAYKSLDAYSYFVNGWVHELYVRQSSTGHSIVKGHVTDSDGLCEEPYKAWVGISNQDGSIISGYCTCMNGDNSHGICSHVVAIVFRMEAAPHLSCSKASACLLCPYHQDTCVVKMEQHQESLAEAQALGVSIKQDQVSDVEDNESQEADDFGEELKQAVFGTGYSVSVSSQENNPRLDVEHGSPHSGQESQEIMSCEMSTMTFATIHLLETHKEEQHKDEHLKPNNTQSKSGDIAHEKTSSRSRREKRSTTCSVCSKVFSRPSDLVRHMRIHTRDGNFSCGDCGESFKDKDHLSIHQKIHKATMEFPKIKFRNSAVKTSGDTKKSEKCSLCNKIFDCHSKLVRHMRTHTGERPFNCDECSKSYRERSKLRAHQRIQHGKMDYDKKSTLEKSTKTPPKSLPVINVDIKPSSAGNVCVLCNKVFLTTFNLTRHMKWHTGEKPYSCDECGRGFVESYKLKKHKRIHAKKKLHVNTSSNENSLTSNTASVKPTKSDDEIRADIDLSSIENSIKCSVCDKVFSCPSILASHMGVHTGERPYSCDTCGKSFKLRYLLRQHKKTHLNFHFDKKVYTCEKCDMYFDWKYLFRAHMNEVHGEEIEYCSCEICGKVFKRMGSLTAHRNQVHTEKMFKCIKCGNKYSTKRSLLFHVSRCRGREKELEKNKCEECGKKFIYKNSLVNHMKLHLDVDQWLFQCTQCEKRFPSKNRLDRHIKTHLGLKPHMCHECGKSYAQVTALNIHMRKHSGEKPYVCDHCDRAFHGKGNFLRHKKLHGAEKQFICRICGKGFHQKTALEYHMGQHTREEPFKCAQCEKSFKRKCQLNFHIKQHHEEKSFQCSSCDKRFAFKSGLLQHMRTHEKRDDGENSSMTRRHSKKDSVETCQVCGRSFGQARHLAIHMNFHFRTDPSLKKEVKNFACSVCDKTFSTSSYRNFHEKFHSGRGEFKCDQCEKNFATRRCLRDHMRIHTGEKPYVCKECGKGFTRRAALYRHMRIHTGELPFKCPTCSRCFRQSSTLYTHMRTHTGEKPFKCNQCCQTFSEKRSLLRHQAKHHVDLPTHQQGSTLER